MDQIQTQTKLHTHTNTILLSFFKKWSEKPLHFTKCIILLKNLRSVGGDHSDTLACWQCWAARWVSPSDSSRSSQSNRPSDRHLTFYVVLCIIESFSMCCLTLRIFGAIFLSLMYQYLHLLITFEICCRNLHIIYRLI